MANRRCANTDLNDVDLNALVMECHREHRMSILPVVMTDGNVHHAVCVIPISLANALLDWVEMMGEEVNVEGVNTVPLVPGVRN